MTFHSPLRPAGTRRSPTDTGVQDHPRGQRSSSMAMLSQVDHHLSAPRRRSSPLAMYSTIPATTTGNGSMSTQQQHQNVHAPQHVSPGPSSAGSASHPRTASYPPLTSLSHMETTLQQHYPHVQAQPQPLQSASSHNNNNIATTTTTTTTTTTSSYPRPERIQRVPPPPLLHSAGLSSSSAVTTSTIPSSSTTSAVSTGSTTSTATSANASSPSSGITINAAPVATPGAVAASRAIQEDWANAEQFLAQVPVPVQAQTQTQSQLQIMQEEAVASSTHNRDKPSSHRPNSESTTTSLSLKIESEISHAEMRLAGGTGVMSCGSSPPVDMRRSGSFRRAAGQVVQTQVQAQGAATPPRTPPTPAGQGHAQAQSQLQGQQRPLPAVPQQQGQYQHQRELSGANGSRNSPTHYPSNPSPTTRDQSPPISPIRYDDRDRTTAGANISSGGSNSGSGSASASGSGYVSARVRTTPDRDRSLPVQEENEAEEEHHLPRHDDIHVLQERDRERNSELVEYVDINRAPPTLRARTTNNTSNASIRLPTPQFSSSPMIPGPGVGVGADTDTDVGGLDVEHERAGGALTLEQRDEYVGEHAHGRSGRGREWERERAREQERRSHEHDDLPDGRSSRAGHYKDEDGDEADQGGDGDEDHHRVQEDELRHLAIRDGAHRKDERHYDDSEHAGHVQDDEDEDEDEADQSFTPRSPHTVLPPGMSPSPAPSTQTNNNDNIPRYASHHQTILAQTHQTHQHHPFTHHANNSYLHFRPRTASSDAGGMPNLDAAVELQETLDRLRSGGAGGNLNAQSPAYMSHIDGLFSPISTPGIAMGGHPLQQPQQYGEQRAVELGELRDGEGGGQDDGGGSVHNAERAGGVGSPKQKVLTTNDLRATVQHARLRRPGAPVPPTPPTTAATNTSNQARTPPDLLPYPHTGSPAAHTPNFDTAAGVSSISPAMTMTMSPRGTPYPFGSYAPQYYTSYHHHPQQNQYHQQYQSYFGAASRSPVGSPGPGFTGSGIAQSPDPQDVFLLQQQLEQEFEEHHGQLGTPPLQGYPFYSHQQHQSHAQPRQQEEHLQQGQPAQQHSSQVQNQNLAAGHPQHQQYTPTPQELLIQQWYQQQRIEHLRYLAGAMSPLSDSTLSPSGTPFPPHDYNPFLPDRSRHPFGGAGHVWRRGLGAAAAAAAMGRAEGGAPGGEREGDDVEAPDVHDDLDLISMRSSPSHLPVPLGLNMAFFQRGSRHTQGAGGINGRSIGAVVTASKGKSTGENESPGKRPGRRVRRVQGSWDLNTGTGLGPESDGQKGNLPPRGESTEPRETSDEDEADAQRSSSEGGDHTAEGLVAYVHGGHGDGERQARSGSATGTLASEGDSGVTARGGDGAGAASAEENQVDPEDNDVAWVDEDEDLDDDDLLHLAYHPTYVVNSEKRQKRWEKKWNALLKTFYSLDKQTDATMILLAAPPSNSDHSSYFKPPKSKPTSSSSPLSPPLRILRSRSLRRSPKLRNASELAQLKTAFAKLETKRRREREEAQFRSVSLTEQLTQFLSSPSFAAPTTDSTTTSSPDTAGPTTTLSSQYHQELLDHTEGLKSALGAALSSLAVLGGIYESREQRWRAEMALVREEREKVDVLMKQALGVGLDLRTETSAYDSAYYGGQGSAYTGYLDALSGV